MNPISSSVAPDLHRRRLVRGGTAAALVAALPSLTACASGVTPGATGTSASVDAALDALLAAPVRIDTDTRADQGVFFGLFREAALTDVVSAAQEDYRIKPAAAMWFSRFGSAFPESAIRYLAQQGMVAQVTWEPWGDRDVAIPLADVVAGKWDAYLDQYGAAAAALDLPFMLRWGHEFNGDWYPWATARNGQSTALFIQAYRRVVERVRAAGARKVQWVWCFNNESTPAGQAWNAPGLAYPGHDVVDWVGIDGYNFGSSQSWSRWTPFRDVFGRAVDTAAVIAPGKPVILAEMACSENGGNKAAWIDAMFADLAAMPSVRAFTWFDIIKETSWAITSSDAAWAATLRGLQSSHTRGNGAALLAVASR